MSNTETNLRFASHCAFCGRLLTDAVSMNRGVGPECSSKYYTPPPQAETDFATLAIVLDGVEGLEAFAINCAVAGDAKEELGDTLKALNLAGKFDARALANEFTYRIAIAQDGPMVVRYTRALTALGFTTLADRIGARLGYRAMGERRGTYTRTGRKTIRIDAVPVAAPRPAPVVRVTRGQGLYGVETYIVETPFSERFNERRRALGRWNQPTKTHHYPLTAREALWRDLTDCFPGVEVNGRMIPLPEVREDAAE